MAWGWKPPCDYGGGQCSGPAEGIPCGAVPQVLLPTPPPHCSYTCFDPKQIRCGSGGGGSCDGEMAINSWGWACCPRRLGDRRENRLKELYWGEDRGKAWPRVGTWSQLGPCGVGANRAGGVVLPSTSICPLNTAPATDCPLRLEPFSTGSGGMQAPVPTPAPHR